MKVLEFLKKEHCKYRVIKHELVYSAEQLAVIENVSPQEIAKPLVIQADGKYYLCVLPANCKIDLYSVKKYLGAESSELAAEQELNRLFDDSEPGTEPPIGNLYNLPTLVDTKLSKCKYILFEACSHQQAVWMCMGDYIRLTNPEIFGFGSPEIITGMEFSPFNPFFL